MVTATRAPTAARAGRVVGVMKEGELDDDMLSIFLGLLNPLSRRQKGVRGRMDEGRCDMGGVNPLAGAETLYTLARFW